MKRKTLIRRKDIDCLFDRTEDYQARIGKIHEKREYDMGHRTKRILRIERKEYQTY